MLPQHRQLIQQHCSYMINNVYLDEEFLAYFIDERIINDSMYEEIMHEKTMRKKIRSLQGLLPKRGTKAFACLIHALMMTNQKEHAEKIAPDEASAWISNHPTEYQEKYINGGGAAGNRRDDKGNTGGGRVPAHQAQNPNMMPRTIQDNGNSLLDIDVLDCDPGWAQRHLQMENEVYQLKSSYRGRAIIINNEFFQYDENKKNLSERTGSIFDAVNLCQLFSRLGFETDTWTDLNSVDLFQNLQKERHREEHKKGDAFILAILSHGNQGKIFTADKKEIPLDVIFSYFDGRQCPYLVGKPKMVFIQACQGSASAQGVVQADGDNDQSDQDASDAAKVSEEEQMIQQHLPSFNQEDTPETVPVVHEKADFIMAYSTVPGFRSWRNTAEGSWFIRDLVLTFMERCHCEHLQDMMLEVNRKQQLRGRYGMQKQVSEIKTSTTKKLYFFPGFSQQPNAL